MTFVEKYRKHIFYIIVALIFLGILAYNFLTPYLLDDLGYQLEAAKANTFFDLVFQQWDEWLYHNGRFVGQFNLRFMLWLGKGVFNVINSIMFTVLILLIYLNIFKVKKYNISILLLSLTFVWIFAIAFGQVMLWLSGACNYLWGSVFILGFITLVRHILGQYREKEDYKLSWIKLVGIFIFGAIAGCCNENTSGGCFLMVLIFVLNHFFNRDKGKRKLNAFMIIAPLSVLCGLVFMISSPGLWSRAGYDELAENYEGIMKYLSHIYKVTVGIRENFSLLLIITIIAIVIIGVNKPWKNFREIRNDSTFIFCFGFLATSYALVIITYPSKRAFYGAGIFLIVAALDAISRMTLSEKTSKYIRFSLVALTCTWLFFTYFENLVNLARINREENSRVSMIEEAASAGESIAVIPQYHPEFANPYSTAMDAQAVEDPDDWVNIFYEQKYGIDKVIALPYEEWEELYGTWE